MWTKLITYRKCIAQSAKEEFERCDRLWGKLKTESCRGQSERT